MLALFLPCPKKKKIQSAKIISKKHTQKKNQPHSDSFPKKKQGKRKKENKKDCICAILLVYCNYWIVFIVVLSLCN